MSSRDTDRQLVEQARHGDARAFSALVERYQRLLTAIAFGILGDEGKADDAVQEAFLSAWKALPKYRGEANFRNWLCCILVNKARSVLRWSRLRRWISLSGEPHEEGGALAQKLADGSAEANPEQGVLEDEQARTVRKAVAQLPLQQRTAVLLRANGLDVVEVAKTMGLAEGTVKAHLHQARLRLAKVLEER